MNKNETLAKLHAIDRECNYLEKALAVLRWDQETCLPELGVEDRSEQLALLEGIAHKRLTSPETGRLLGELGSVPENPRGGESLPDPERDFLKVLRRNYDRAVKLPSDFVAAAAKAEGLSQACWVQAKRNNDFAAFLPYLEAMIAISRKRADYWGYKDNAYDGLLDIYEPGMSSDDISAVFGPLGERLSALLGKIAAKPGPDTSFLECGFDTGVQTSFNKELMKRLGFDTRRGRLDVSAHPFTTTLGADDVRITTRYLRDNPLSAIFSTIHECGHAFYELAFPAGLRGSCLADGASMGIHESQSRLWENVIGRSRPFWEGFFPLLRSYFPEQFKSVGIDSFYQAVNQARPSLIRVEADEVSYSLHIILRFELEKALFSGSLEPADLPGFWRRRMKEILGVEPETDAEGVLQDVHWSMGSFGYFPSYALGNLYGLQFFRTLKADLPHFEEDAARGDFSALHSWLADTIYVWGRRLDPPDLLKKVTGQSLSAGPFLQYIEEKYADVYGI
ncbi:MAG: carboxypeptidase M32 [Treponema sp.]|jgi:carboxypeptidase Taq|nr:carboxypeptidase M32 [Treponema sp.]